MLTVFSYQVLRLLRDRVLLVWTLGFPVVLSLIFMAMFSNLDKAYEATPMSFGVVQDEAYREAPGLDAVVEQISSDDADPHLITKVTHPTASEAEAAAKRGDTNGYLAVEDGEPVLHVTQKGNEAETTRVLRVVMDSYTQRRAEHEVILKAGTPPEQVAALQAERSFTRSISVTPAPVKPETQYYFSLLAFACGMGATVALVAVQGIMATSPLGARHTMAGLPRWKVLTATLAASWVCVLGCLLVAFVFMATVVGVDFGPHVLLCLVAIGVCSLMSSAAGAALGTIGRLGVGPLSGISSLLSLFTGLYGPAAQSLATSVERNVPLLAQANPLWQAARCFYGLLYYDSLTPFARSCAALLGMTCLFLTIALIRARRMNHEHL
ncbi:ABC transporter permease [Actinomyces viscosus]|uniref:ABC-2 family transporter protein n=1 Tax=Actinomyces viscosus TaxID=1656 RepID=A0A448PH47_ACTVI|nr:ABC transporter permease [Actinomyces viscosus]TFH53125.1 ABC transporter permease [Actinomyces viscosus]VEI14238.1 ABC-2 family transporter protein [Actinomyces viscosus]